MEHEGNGFFRVDRVASPSRQPSARETARPGFRLPPLVRRLRDHLQLPPDRRSDERIAWVENVRIQPVYSEREIGEAVAAQTRDISVGGMGLELPSRPPCDFLLVQICPPHRAPVLVPLQGLYTQPRGDGRHYVGARFAWELVQEGRS